MAERALIVGLGRFGGGSAAARFLAGTGCRVRISDRAGDEALAESRAALAGLPSAEWCLGREDTALLDGVDTVVVNPAVPDGHPLLAAARAAGIAVTQELDLFLDHYPGEVVLVTGTNGKSTTTTLLHRCLRAAGRDALCGGNIGHSLLADAARWRRDQVAVVEASSFQLERLAAGRRVHGSVFTRVGSDHLDRHGTLERYRLAKGAAARAAREFVVHLRDDPVAAAYPTGAERLAAGAGGACGVDGGWLVAGGAGGGRLAHVDAFAMPGAFHHENAALAAAAALRLGCSRHPIGLAICTAEPLPHRFRRLGAIGGVDVYDNSVSTEVESTRAAMTGIAAPVRWVGGGKSKDGRFDRVAERLAGSFASAHLFGAAAAPLAAELRVRGVTDCTLHASLADATAAALAAARPGEALLFSPAFASFDQFVNFRARAEAFYACLARHGLRSPGTRVD